MNTEYPQEYITLLYENRFDDEFQAYSITRFQKVAVNMSVCSFLNLFGVVFIMFITRAFLFYIIF